MFEVQFIPSGGCGTVSGFAVALNIDGKRRWHDSFSETQAATLIALFYDLGHRGDEFHIYRRDHDLVLVNETNKSHHVFYDQEFIIPLLSHRKESLDGEYLMRWKNLPVRFYHVPNYDEIFHVDEV
jgi:hypothetical protein